MKCNRCNAEVAEGINFCPECGNRIEYPQLLKCPQCNMEVADGTKFCPECGSPIGVPQPKKCCKCGAEIEDGENFCSNCGAPVNNSPIQQSNVTSNKSVMGTSVNLFWDAERRQPLWNNPIFVYKNQQKCAEFIPKESFEKMFNNVDSNFEIELEFGKGPFNKTSINLDLENGHNYLLSFYMNAMSSFGYELKDENGRLIKEDGDIGWLQFVCFLFIPLIGFIYYFAKKGVQPISAKAGLLLGFGNICLAILRFLF